MEHNKNARPSFWIISTPWQYHAEGAHAGVQLEIVSNDSTSTIEEDFWDQSHIDMKIVRRGQWGAMLLSSDLALILHDTLISLLHKYNNHIRAKRIMLDGTVLDGYKCVYVPTDTCEVSSDSGLALLFSMRQLSDTELATAFGLHIDSKEWSGADVFVPRFDTKLFVTSRVAIDIRSRAFSYLECVPSDEYGFSIAQSHAMSRIARGVNTKHGMPSLPPPTAS